MLKHSVSKLLAVYKVQASAKQRYVTKESILLEGPGSTHNFIKHQFALDPSLASKQIKIRGKVPERQQKLHQTKSYRFDLKDMQETKHEVCPIGMDSIITVVEEK